MSKNNRYAKAYKEVLEIIKYFPEEDYNKIPKEKIQYYQENMDQDYEFTIDPGIDLSVQNISKEANAIIVNLYQDYFATEEKKEIIKKILELNEKKLEQEKRKKYNPDDVFKIAESIEKNKSVIQDAHIVECKESFFTKFKNLIKKIFHLS